MPLGGAVRPATDGLRQAVFSSLGTRVGGSRFLDLFAGSGAYGLEALSRGAAGGVFVERDARAVACLRRNLAAVCKSLGRDAADVHVTQADASTAWVGGPPADLVFVDPPYALIADLAPRLFARLAEPAAVGAGGLVLFEMPGECALAPAGWREIKRLGKGARAPTAAIFERAPAG